MPIPWLRLFDALIGVGNLAMARRLERRTAADDERGLERRGGVPGQFEARLGNVVVAALKEVFDRDSRRLEFEREQMEAERARAERLLRLELNRQSGEREIGRLKVLTAVTVVSLVTALGVSVALIGRSAGARVMLGVAWALLLVALAAAFMGQSTVARSLADIDLNRPSAIQPPVSAVMAPWLIVAGLALVAIAILTA